jgi:hypothetical protein
MDEITQSQRTHNSAFAEDLTIAPLAEALWRLRLAPSALDLHTVLPAKAFVSPVLVDFTSLLGDIDVELLDVHAILMLPPGPAEVIAAS